MKDLINWHELSRKLSGNKLSKEKQSIDKELSNWIYWEEGHIYYCFECIILRLEEINKNKEFSEDINYEGGDECGYYQDYANEDYEVECCKCCKPLFSTPQNCG